MCGGVAVGLRWAVGGGALWRSEEDLGAGENGKILGREAYFLFFCVSLQLYYKELLSCTELY